MSGPSEQDARPIAEEEEEEEEEEEVCKANEEIPSSAAAEVNEEISSAGQISSSAAAEAEVDKLSLSGNKPFFDVILSKSQFLPAHAVPMLPRAVVPMVFTHGDKDWHATYNGLVKRPSFDYAGWRKFVVGNNLQCEDACIFEVMESSTTIVRLRVVILRNTDCLPPELEADIESVGKTPETAIEID